MTEITRHPVDLALRTMTTTHDPSRADFDHARGKLIAAIALTTPPRLRARAWSRPWAIGLALMVVIGLLLIQTASTSPAEAVITELARVVDISEPLVVPDTEFAYTHSGTAVLIEISADELESVDTPHESLFLLLPETRETWIGEDGTVRLRRKFLRPVFFSPAEEEAYYAAGRDETDQIGETVTGTQPDANGILDETDWPTDPRELETTIRSRVGDADPAVLEECLKLLRETLISPHLRAAVLRVIAGLELEVVDQSPEGATFAIALATETPMRMTFTLDSTGHLVFEEVSLIDGYPDHGVPAGTADRSATYSVPVLVDSLP